MPKVKLSRVPTSPKIPDNSIHTWHHQTPKTAASSSDGTSTSNNRAIPRPNIIINKTVKPGHPERVFMASCTLLESLLRWLDLSNDIQPHQAVG